MYIQQFNIYLSSICYICDTWTSQSKLKIEQKTHLQKNFNEKEKARKTRTKYKTAIMTTRSPNRYTSDQIVMSHNLIIELEKLKSI